VVSSYTPTLTALIDGLKPRAQSNPKVLAVALPLESGLPCVQKEIDSIGKHGTVSKLLETEATVKNVVMGMQQANWVHFACHGVHDISNPTKSALLLAGHARLTLSDISKLSLPTLSWHISLHARRLRELKICRKRLFILQLACYWQDIVEWLERCGPSGMTMHPKSQTRSMPIFSRNHIQILVRQLLHYKRL